MQIAQVAIETVYRNIVNVFITKGESLTIIDAGFKSEQGQQQIEAALKEWGYTLHDVEQVVLTHHHPDHCGLVDIFPTATIVGHSYCNHYLQPSADFLAYYEAYHMKLLAQHGIFGVEQVLQDFLQSDMPHFGRNPVTHALQHGDEVPGMPGFVAHYTPGHCQSHFIYVNEKSGVGFGGDLLLDSISPNPFVEPPLDLSMRRDKSMLLYKQSLEVLRTLSIDTLYTGHGESIRQIEARIDETLQQQHKRAMKLLSFFEAGTYYQTPQLTKQLFGPVFQKQPALTLSETLGQLDDLVDKGHVHMTMNDNQIYYSI